MKISVVVCTYNRSKLLSQCLESLANQTFDKNLYEVIVVDNNSTDDTKEIIKIYTEKYLNFKSYIETQQGSSYARNLGAIKSSGEFIAFIDDDGKAFPDWIEKMEQFIDAHPGIRVFGGPYIGINSKKIPFWFPQNYGSWGLGSYEKMINFPKEWLSGSNLIIKKNTFLEVGGFDIKKGPRGKKFAYGEDTYIIYTLNNKNISIWYAPEVKIYHLTADKKFDFSWIFKSGYNAGKVDELIFNHRHNLFYYFFLFIFHFFKYGIILFSLKDFGGNIFRFFHTIAYDVGMFVSKFRNS